MYDWIVPFARYLWERDTYGLPAPHRGSRCAHVHGGCVQTFLHLELFGAPPCLFKGRLHINRDIYTCLHCFHPKVNHLPCSFHLGRKDRLWRNVSAMQLKHGFHNFDFVPLTFCMPNDLEKLKAAWDQEGSCHQWILKPVGSDWYRDPSVSNRARNYICCPQSCLLFKRGHSSRALIYKHQ